VANTANTNHLTRLLSHEGRGDIETNAVFEQKGRGVRRALCRIAPGYFFAL
jgi:hypothetical protein